MPWFWDLVAMSGKIPLCSPKLLTQPFSQITHKNLSNLNLHTWLLVSAIKEHGFSEAVAEQIEAPQRGSTRSVYEAKRISFTKRYHSNQADFRVPSIRSLADFLLYLFQDRKLQPSTIDGYRSAIADKLGNIIHQCQQGQKCLFLIFSIDRPKGCTDIPSWNLSLDLHQLTKAPFNPLKKHLERSDLQDCLPLSCGFKQMQK